MPSLLFLAQRQFIKITGLCILVSACTFSGNFDAGAINTSFAIGNSKMVTQLENATLEEIIGNLDDGTWTSEQVVRGYLARIEEIDPKINAVLALNPEALPEAKRLDEEREAGKVRSALHGVPILVKDNIETRDPVATTAGALSLANNLSDRDAPMIARLRDAGVIILGKSNLSEWANFRSSDSISGWSAIGGQTRNPHRLSRNPCGSSAGSGAAAAAALAAGTIGTETNGSIICPSNANGIVGFKPTVGLVSRTHIVPISPTQDTAGPMTRSVYGAAALLEIMAGTDPADPATSTADMHKLAYTEALSTEALQGKRIGVARFAAGTDPRINALFDEALSVLQQRGAVLVEIEEWSSPEDIWDDEYLVLQAEFKASLNDYLASTPQTIEARSLAAVIAFNKAHKDQTMPLFGQDILESSQAMNGLEDEDYQAALARILKATREDGIDALLKTHDVDLIVAPSGNPTFLIEPVFGDQYKGGVGMGWVAAIAGYPHLTVPMGDVLGLPVGLSFISGKWRDADVIKAGYAYEQASHKIMQPQFIRDEADAPAIRDAMKPGQTP